MSEDIFNHDLGVICYRKKTICIPKLMKLNILNSEMGLFILVNCTFRYSPGGGGEAGNKSSCFKGLLMDTPGSRYVIKSQKLREF